MPECGGCTEAEILAAVGRTRLLFEPFTSTAYSNLGSALLGRALEKVANTSWEEWVTRRILAPLNMTRSGGWRCSVHVHLARCLALPCPLQCIVPVVRVHGATVRDADAVRALCVAGVSYDDGVRAFMVEGVDPVTRAVQPLPPAGEVAVLTAIVTLVTICEVLYAAAHCGTQRTLPGTLAGTVRRDVFDGV